MTSLEQQSQAIETGAGFYERTDYHTLEVNGPEAPPFLHRLLSQNIQKQEAGQFLHAALLDRKGMLLSLMGVLRMEQDRFLLMLPEGLFQKTWGLLKKFKFIDKVEFADRSGDFAFFYIIGPAGGGNLPEQTGLFSWQESIYQKTVYGLLVPTQKVALLKRSFEQKGWVPLEKKAFDLLRLEAGIPEYGVDVNEETLVLEGNLHFAVARNKGCYPGQEVVERIYAYGKGRTPRNLCRLEWPHEEDISPGTPLHDPAGKPVGKVTSALRHPVKKKLLLLAMVERKFLEGMPTLSRKEGLWVLS